MTRDSTTSNDEAVLRGWHDPHSDSTAVQIVIAVATVEGVEPAELEPLEYTVDTDALDILLRSLAGRDGRSGGRGRISFSFCGYEIVVAADGWFGLWSAN